MYAKRPKNFNPRSPHGERPDGGTADVRAVHISIHAPRTGSDRRRPHGAPRHGFQSTLPARGATTNAAALEAALRDFNPRSPHGERRKEEGKPHKPEGISIHAPRTGSDGGNTHANRYFVGFQSTLPARGATSTSASSSPCLTISIHAPRTGGDQTGADGILKSVEISIHAPRTGSDRLFRQ